jgi:hypothetical protein
MRKQLLLLFILGTLALHAETKRSYTWYGFVRNDFYYNSRQNEESLDGIFHFYPKPVVIASSGDDLNAVPQAEMLSIASRIGLDIKGEELYNARVSAKLEMDFAGTGSTYFLMRIRQAYVRFDGKASSLLIGQTWHPLWGDVTPTVVSFNSGSPFQPFNRSPQLRLTHQLFKNLNLTGAAVWQMQTSSNGPLGFTPIYMKNSLTPDLFAGMQYSGKNLTAGGALDYKRIQPETDQTLSSLSASAYIQYKDGLFCIKGKTVYGNNLADHIMLGGYGLYYNPSDNNFGYTNLTSTSSWLNIVYGKTWQAGMFAGLHQNLGSQLPMLHRNVAGQYTIYGRGFYKEQQELLDRMVRIAPFVTHSINNFMFGVEYNLTLADYGKIQTNGRVSNPYTVTNHRMVATVVYNF